MKDAFKFLAIAASIAVLAHGAVILGAPRLIMGVAMKRISDGGLKTNMWLHGPRTDESSRRVVRPSPDLAYSACVYDVAGGPVMVTAAPWDDYMSVSVYAANSDNIFTVNDRQAPRGARLLLTIAADRRPTPAGFIRVVSPTGRGIVIERRLAPTAVRFAKAAAARAGDICRQLPKS